tara:strand:- start:91 stop:381 length:291 start_codon:yes stop_codon:yes gene_type:complete
MDMLRHLIDTERVTLAQVMVVRFAPCNLLGLILNQQIVRVLAMLAMVGLMTGAWLALATVRGVSSLTISKHTLLLMVQQIILMIIVIATGLFQFAE